MPSRCSSPFSVLRTLSQASVAGIQVVLGTVVVLLYPYEERPNGLHHICSCLSTLSRELNYIPEVANLCRYVIHHVMHVWCDTFLLVPLKLTFSP